MPHAKMSSATARSGQTDGELELGPRDIGVSNLVVACIAREGVAAVATFSTTGAD